MIFNVYRIGQPVAEFPSVKAMERAGWKATGKVAEGRMLRDCLRGQPMFEGLAGPMYDGSDEAIRYESWETYDLLSR